MTCEAHIICWNRQDTIAFTIKHYQQFCGRVIIYDNHSNDFTRDIAESLGAIVKTFGRPGELNDQAYLDVKNNCWKGSKADWVIVVDDDEILYHPDLVFHLELATVMGSTIFRPQGFNIHSEEMPVESFTEILTGEPNENYSKLCIFNPRKISEIRYNFGCHAARPVGDLVYDKAKLILLHYREIGGVERLINRHREYEKRLSEINRRWNLGHHYTESEEAKRQQWEEFTKRSVHLSKAGLL
jgi:glycosyltransferase involved in cell wall biosynthesis